MVAGYDGVCVCTAGCAENQRRALQAVEDAVLAEGEVAMSQGNAVRLEYALLAMSGTHPADSRKAGQLKLSSECMAPIHDIVAKAKTGNTRPILQLACSMGLRPHDVGDYYTCSQSSYGYQYWQISLGEPSFGNGGGGHGRRLQHHHGGWDTTIGLCMPLQCAQDDLEQMAPFYLRELHVNATTSGPHGGTAGASSIANHSQYYLKGVAKAGGHTGMPIDAGFIIWSVVALLFVLFTICATSPAPCGLKAPKAPPPASNSLQGVITPAPLVQSGGAVLPTTTAPPASPPTAIRVINNWDMSRNYASLAKPDAGHEGLKVLNGIRVIAIGLVVLGHTYAFLRVDNQPYASNIVETRFMTYWIIGVHTDSSGGAFLSVDSFFFLSGFLAMLSQLEKYSLGEGKRLSLCKYWGQAMMYRFLRLTPMYLFTLMIYIYVYPQFGNGPNWMTGDERQTKSDGTVQDFCREAWWTNVSQSCYYSFLRYRWARSDRCCGCRDVSRFCISQICFPVSFRFLGLTISSCRTVRHHSDARFKHGQCVPRFVHPIT